MTLIVKTIVQISIVGSISTESHLKHLNHYVGLIMTEIYSHGSFSVTGFSRWAILSLKA